MAELTAHGIQLSSKETYVNIDEKTNQLMQKEAEFKDIASTVIRQTSNYTSANMKVAASAETMTGGYIMIQGELEGPITTILQTMFDNMKKVTTEQQTMVQNIEKRFTEPMRTLVNYKFANVEYAKDQVKKSVATYQDHMEQFSKNISLKSAKEASKFITLEKELQQLKEVINQNTETFIETYQQFSKTKNRTLVSSYTNLVRDLHAYHKKSLETMDKILPMVEGIEQEYRKQEEIDPIVGEKIIKEGLLSIKRTKWNDEYCELRGGKFYCYKADTAFSPENTLELQLCSVKSILPEKEREKVSKETAACCFQVFTPGQARPMIVRCESESVKKEWEAAFLEGISAALDNGRDGKQTQNDADNNNETVLAIVREIPGNTVCADCGAPEPVWASINLGIVVCLGCSGIHRSLGSHISKVRSLTLDHWDPELLMYMTQLGNTRANQFFECRAMQFDQSLRPTENSKTEDRKVWINMKYKEKKFIPPLPEGYSLDTTFYELVKLNKEMDIMRAVTLLFYGADTEQIDCFGLTPLMQACIADNWLYAQALVLHGKNILATDLQKWTALHHATYHNSYRSLQVLTRGLKDFDLTTLTDYANDTPMNIASRFDFKEATIILNKESLLSFKVTKRLLDLMENENKFSLKSFEEITSIELLTEDVKEDSESEEEVSEFEVHPDESQVKWVRAADSNVDTVKSTDKSKFNLIPKKKKSTKIKQATLSRVAAADRPFRRKSSTPSLLEKVDSAGKRSQITDFASNLSQAPDPEPEDLTSGDD